MRQVSYPATSLTSMQGQGKELSHFASNVRAIGVLPSIESLSACLWRIHRERKKRFGKFHSSEINANQGDSVSSGQGATDAVWQVATEIVRMKEAARAREEATRQSTKRPAPSSSEPEEASTSRTRAKAQEASPTRLDRRSQVSSRSQTHVAVPASR